MSLKLLLLWWSNLNFNQTKMNDQNITMPFNLKDPEKHVLTGDFPRGVRSEPKTYWYTAEIPEIAVVTIFGHFRREIKMPKIKDF